MASRSSHVVLDDLLRRDRLALVEEVAVRRGVLVDPLCGTARTLSVSHARQEVWWRMRRHPEHCFSLFEIARLFGRHHPTVMAGVAAHTRRLEQDADPSATRS